MSNLKLKFALSAVLLLLVSSVFAQSGVNYVQYVYWYTTDYGVGSAYKAKRSILMNREYSVEQVLYVIPPGATDTLAPQKETRETVVNAKGETVNKIVLRPGNYKAYAPQNEFRLYKKNNFQLVSDKVNVLHTSDDYILDDVPGLSWKITEKRKKIGDFECVQAISKPFRGRSYIAWFAPEIPISNGPWKLGGLPGLILEAEDKKGQVKFIFESLLINPESPLAVHDPYEQSTLPRIDWEEYKKKTKEAEQRLFKSRAAKGIQQVGYKVTREESTD